MTKTTFPPALTTNCGVWVSIGLNMYREVYTGLIRSLGDFDDYTALVREDDELLLARTVLFLVRQGQVPVHPRFVATSEALAGYLRHHATEEWAQTAMAVLGGVTGVSEITTK